METNNTETPMSISTTTEIPDMVVVDRYYQDIPIDKVYYGQELIWSRFPTD